MTLLNTARALALSVCCVSLSGHAALVTSLPGGTPINLPAANADGVGPFVIEPGITYSSSVAHSSFGLTGIYGFGANGFWSGPSPMIGLNEGTGSMTLAFASPISGFLAQVSWSKLPLLTAPMSAVGSGDVALEAWVFSSDGSNLLAPEGFYGFSRASNDIVAIRFENDFIGARDMSYSRIAQGNVPVPGVLALLGIGLLGLGGLRRVARAGA